MGIHYAILLGILTGILNQIPYIGIIVAILLSIASTLTGVADVSIIAGVVRVNVIVLLPDANVLVPIVVSTRVKMNAFISILLINL